MQKAAVQRARRHLAPGDKLGKYEVIRQIAVGGMAELYLSRTTGIEGFEKLVVVKRILPQYVTNSSFVDMFLNEARLAATLHHPNIAQVYDIGLEDGDYFFAMEYVHGEDLDHMAIAADEQGVPISLDAGLTLVAGLCAGLHYAHEKASAEGRPLQIVHRDVSPSNVLVSYDGAVKLVDFGIARASSRPGTTQGGLKGKIAFMSPEQCRAKAQLDRRSDIYAVGTILYQLTTGRLPFAGETEYQILNQIVNDDAPPPSSVVRNYPPALEKIVMRALARDVNNRYSTALEVQGAVEDFAHDSRLRVSSLVLARLMGTLFPARLEEWDHAKAQGAFFVEQHVVRTLIESGRTPDRSDPDTRAKVAAAVATDDDPTQINQPLPLQDLGGDTTVGVDPIATELSPSRPGMPTRAGTPPPPNIPATPLPQAYPIVNRGTLVSSTGATSPIPAAGAGPAASILGPSTPMGFVQATPPQADVTERVRAPSTRHTSPTSFVRAEPKRRGVLAFVGLLVVAGGIAAFIVTRGDQAAPSAAPSAEPSAPEAPVVMQPSDDQAKPAAEVPEAEPAAAPVEAAPAIVTPEPPTQPAVAEPAAAEPTTEPAVADTVADTKTDAKKPAKSAVASKRPKAKPVEKKAEPKDGKTWNADSPFMPVRTGK